MSLEMTIPEIFQTVFSVFLGIVILSGIYYVTEPIFIETKTMNNEMMYVEIISNEDMEIKFISENDEIILKTTDETYNVEVEDSIVPFPNKGYTSNRRFTQQEDYIILS